jgi:hypothetical protein
LALAVGFAVALNGALVASFGSPHASWMGLPQTVVSAICWSLVLGLWSCGLVWLWRDSASTHVNEATNREAVEAQFQLAQQEYLRGHWIEAESLLGELLSANAHDVEARLLLASVQRRTKRWSEARSTLARLRDEPLAARWLPEIEAELARIDELEGEARKESGGEGELSRAA